MYIYVSGKLQARNTTENKILPNNASTTYRQFTKKPKRCIFFAISYVNKKSKNECSRVVQYQLTYLFTDIQERDINFQTNEYI